MHASEGYFNMVLAGAFTDLVGRAEVAVGRGDVVFHPPGEMRANRFEAPTTMLFNVHLPVRELACLGGKDADTWWGHPLPPFGPWSGSRRPPRLVWSRK